ncbi:hypothetical protein BGZ80_002429 [Entomortierella chlamydospora]|uniref:Uncharacterized protein n=1 Tax=Entomortierella chlamydospora TaxID=101097 RepID=A0A9P6N684_9FUNG|nr:hypothetical protein BGZ80_002429 [Entomortierella chlamydospora]
MSPTLAYESKTLKAKKTSRRPTTDDVFNTQHLRSASAPSLGLAQPKSYTSFITELISAFNSLSSPSTAPTSSSTLHAFFQGVDHEAHVDERQKRKVVKALQLADPAKVNEVISILKAMPDPTSSLVGPTNQKSLQKELAKQEQLDKERTKQEQLDKELTEWDKIEKKKYWETQKSNDQATGVVDPESCKGLMSPSWWLSSTEPPSPTPTGAAPNKGTLTKASSTGTLFKSSWLTSKSKSEINDLSANETTKKSLSTGEQIALAAASLLATVAVAKPKDPKVGATTTTTTDCTIRKSSSISRQSSMSTIKPAKLKALLPTTKSSTATGTIKNPPAKAVVPVTSDTSSSSPSSLIGSISAITRQFLNLDGPPSASMISACTFWWGYEIYIPHKSIATIEHVTNTSQVFFNILSNAISGVPGLAALVPIAKIIAAWVGYQWTVIKSENRGKGVIISAIWILPVALASRAWDLPGHEDSTFQSLKSKLSLVGV